ncbi:cobalt-precorrin-5B (C(1))-methyltransferase [Propylenella binzhouense]|uniref:Cobalt-precorrin-5B C(1)-methyltransferase n=1 Tax=Propylenella binzhouense TaxID=2555902 RepID=A0A964T802_9HYPH|nr:cobalt-precorrin-5B (C(1))-methyltransferase [Propylenella binzhouense]MYZ50203.1 cobalt-precorrin-5B (C(1))-methyltransferase [Propylenella binzhouense]
MAEGTAERAPGASLRRGWTTGACATAAAKAAFEALLTGHFPDPVSIRLPRGETPAFALARERLAPGLASASVIKDAGDDPDVTHGAEVTAVVRRLPEGSGIRFRAGPGVGTVTRPGLPVPPGEPAINPVPRRMMAEAVGEVAAAHGIAADAEIEIGVAGGEALAAKTWNPRLGILGGLSILGTTGIVVPFSCAAWIHAIHRGIDVARAAGLDHVAGATGNASEAAARHRYGLPEIALLDMGDFAGGMLKYLRTHPVAKVTVAGGFAKMAKLGQGALDLHSGRSQVDRAFLAELAAGLGARAALLERLTAANTAAEALALCEAEGLPIAGAAAERARASARSVLRDAPILLNVLIVGRDGNPLAETGHG